MLTGFVLIVLAVFMAELRRNVGLVYDLTSNAYSTDYFG